ncbi:MAG: 6-phosphogluconolactonase [Pseudomonadota bacterium]
MSAGVPESQIFSDAGALALAVAGGIATAAAEALSKRGCFKIVLAGGTTPMAVYRELADCATDGSRWRIYFGDERCVLPEDSRRNDRAIREVWLDRVSSRVFAIPAERGPRRAALDYTSVVEAEQPFDLVLLGLGEDGHTASLFPGHLHPQAEWVHPVYGAPKPPPERVSLSRRAFCASRMVWFLVTGAGKAGAWRAWQAGEALPAAGIRGMFETRVWLDAAAAGRTEPMI